MQRALQSRPHGGDIHDQDTDIPRFAVPRRKLLEAAAGGRRRRGRRRVASRKSSRRRSPAPAPKVRLAWTEVAACHSPLGFGVAKGLYAKQISTSSCSIRAPAARR